jgi:hypothetical protein
VRRTFWPSHLLLSNTAYVPVASCRYCLYRVLADKVSGNPTGNPKVSAADLLGRLDLLALPLFHHHSGSALSLVSPISSTPFRCTDDSVDCFWCLAPFEFVHQTIMLLRVCPLLQCRHPLSSFHLFPVFVLSFPLSLLVFPRSHLQVYFYTFRIRTTSYFGPLALAIARW